jgi:hypothetical protein
MQQTGQHYDPEMGEARYKVYLGVMHDYMGEGPNGQSIQSFDRFLGHAYEASQAVNDARNGKVPWLNTPVNRLSKLTGSQRSPALINFQIKLETARTEYQNFLNNNHALHAEDIKKMNAIIDDSASPAQVQEALKAMANIARDRLRSMDFSFTRATGSHIPNLLSPEGSQSLQHFGVDPKSIYTTMTPQRAIPAAGANVPTGAGATAPPPIAGANAPPIPAGHTRVQLSGGGPPQDIPTENLKKAQDRDPKLSVLGAN